MRIAILGICALALAACELRPAAPAANETVPVVPEPAKTVPPAADIAVSANAATIPAAFHGRWGMVPEDCTSQRGDAKGLLTIDATTLRFYESRAAPREIEILGADQWRAELDYSGEGQSWTETTTVNLSNSGKTLTRMADGPWTYQRCEG